MIYVLCVSVKAIAEYANYAPKAIEPAGVATYTLCDSALKILSAGKCDRC